MPPGVDEPDMYRQRSGWAMVPKDEDFWEYLRPQREAFHPVHTNGKAPTNGHVVAAEAQTEKQPV
jgi:hypothetical protein